MITRNFNLFLNAGKHIPLVINVNQYDHDEQWCFTLLNDNGEKYIPSTGAIVGIKADRLGIINSGTVNASGQVVISETEQMTAAVGKAVFELLIDDQTHGTANFAVLVEPKPGNNADFSESDLSLLQEAIDGTSAAAIAEGVGNWMDDNLEPGEWVIDSSLTVQGAAADAKKVGDEISDVKRQIAQMSFKQVVKDALMSLADAVMYIDSTVGNQVKTQLYNALNQVDVTSISAVFDQGENLIFSTDDIDSLKQYLTVTAHFDDDTSAEVSSYTLSGDLDGGQDEITVTYQGKTTTFTADVIASTDVSPLLSSFVSFNNSYLEVTYNSSDDSLRLKTKQSNKRYTYAYTPFSLESGYGFKITWDVEIASGEHKITLAKDNVTYIGGGDPVITTNGTYSMFRDTIGDSSITNVNNISIYNTFETAMSADITVRNLKVIKFAIPLGGE